ncbi:MAG: ABC transporter permease [Proteobacteria bacterium]|nr:MAG: ABC transporter permease [Pseudomonadota bacterium]
MQRQGSYKDLITELLRKELRVRYKHLSLGYLWSIANPLAYATLYYIVFGMIMKVKTPNYPVFLIVSLFPWQWLNNSILVGPMTFYGNAGLIKKTLFPRFLIPFVVVLQDLIHFVATLPIIFGFLVFYHVELSWSLLFSLPLMLALQFVLAYALNLLIASVNLFFRDLERVLQLLMTFLFYLTPVLYDESLIPEKFQYLIIVHPIAPLMINWRNIFLHGHLDFAYFISSCVWASALLVISQFTYKKLQWRFAEVL